MAYFVQGLAGRIPALTVGVLLSVAGSLAGQSFSHAEALRAVKGCQPCHAPIPKSSEVSRREARPVRWVKFSHAIHVKLPGVAQSLMQAIDSKKYLGAATPELRKLLETENVCDPRSAPNGEATRGPNCRRRCRGARTLRPGAPPRGSCRCLPARAHPAFDARCPPPDRLRTPADSRVAMGTNDGSPGSVHPSTVAHAAGSTCADTH